MAGGCGSGCRRSGARGRAADRAASGARRSLSVTTRAPGASTAGRAPPRAPVPAPARRRYGGSRKTRSYASPRADASRSAARAGARTTRGLVVAEPERLQIGADRPRPRARRARRAWRCAAPARERLDAQRARARRTGRARARRRAARASRTAPRARGRRSAACRGPRGARSRRPPKRPATTLTPPDRRSASRPRVGAQRVAQQRVLGRPQARVLAQQRRRARRGRARAASASSGRRAKRKRAQARLARAGQLALAAQLEVDLGQLEAVACARPAPAGARESAGPKSRHSDACSPRPTRPRSWCSCEMP